VYWYEKAAAQGHQEAKRTAASLRTSWGRFWDWMKFNSQGADWLDFDMD